MHFTIGPCLLMVGFLVAAAVGARLDVNIAVIIRDPSSVSQTPQLRYKQLVFDHHVQVLH